MPDYCARCSCTRRPSRASTAAPARATRRAARCARSGTRRGWRNPRRWSRARAWWTRRPRGSRSTTCCPLARDYDLAVLHTSTPSFAARRARGRGAARRGEPALCGSASWAPTWPCTASRRCAASPAIEFVARQRVRLHDPGGGRGAARRAACAGSATATNGSRAPHARARRRSRTWTRCPSWSTSTSATSTVEHYFIGYLLHPYVSLYTGRGCRSKCTFCLWPQTVGGQRYRTRSRRATSSAEIARAQRLFPQVQEFFFDDDTFTDDLPRAEAIARGLGRLGVTWSCNAKANVPAAHAQGAARQRPAPAAGGLRVGQPGHPEQHQEGHPPRRRAASSPGTPRRSASRSTARSSSGCPARRRETIEETIRFACEIDPHTIQVSLAAPYPGHRAAPPGAASRAGCQATTSSTRAACS